MGEDTDTTAAVTGGLAGIYYGAESIPIEWMTAIARQNDIIALATRLETSINQSTYFAIWNLVMLRSRLTTHFSFQVEES